MGLGNAARIREEIYRINSIALLGTVWRDMGFAARTLRRSPGFTLVAILTLALDVGANTAIFGVMYAILIKPLPCVNPNQLVSMFESARQKAAGAEPFSYPNFLECCDRNRAFSEMAGYNAHDLVLTGAGEPAEVHTIVVTPEIFSLLGAKPFLGRAFFREDGRAGAAPVVVLSESLWRSLVGGWMPFFRPGLTRHTQLRRFGAVKSLMNGDAGDLSRGPVPN